MHESSGITDYFLIASGFSAPHLKAMFRAVEQELKIDGIPCYRKTGDSEAGWMVLDYVDLVIHIFFHETRDYYAIEKLWADAPRIELRNP